MSDNLRCAVIGAGLAGCEAALWLADRVRAKAAAVFPGP